MSPLCPTLGWEYPLELRTDQAFDNFDLDSVFLTNNLSSSSQVEDYRGNQESSDHGNKRSESPQGTSSTDKPLLSKKLNHNANERDRRKKINDMYSSLRALLPATDQRVHNSFLDFLTNFSQMILVNFFLT